MWTTQQMVTHILLKCMPNSEGLALMRMTHILNAPQAEICVLHINLVYTYVIALIGTITHYIIVVPTP